MEIGALDLGSCKLLFFCVCIDDDIAQVYVLSFDHSIVVIAYYSSQTGRELLDGLHYVEDVNLILDFVISIIIKLLLLVEATLHGFLHMSKQIAALEVETRQLALTLLDVDGPLVLGKKLEPVHVYSKNAKGLEHYWHHASKL